MMSARDERLVATFVEQAQHGMGFISQAQLDDGWGRLQGAASPPGRPARRRPRAWLYGLATASAFTAAAAMLHRPATRPESESPLHYVLEGAATARESVVTSVPGEPARLRFSDASRVELGAGTRLKVAAMDARGAHVVLLEGTVDVDVTHRPNSSWQFAAGPFRVEVKGTSFRLAFDALRGRLTLEMTTGLAEVSAPPQRKLAVRAGESLELHADVATPEPPSAGAPVRGATTPEPAPAPPSKADSPRVAARRMAARGTEPADGPAAPEPPSWSTLLAKGNFSAVVEDAERRGIDTVLARASAADLSSLADSARYTKRHELAQKALLAVRARFAGTEPAKDAAFFLGRLAEASSRQPEAALAWYDTYLREAPRGLYASETLGREMTLLAPGAPARAHQVARTYLLRFPRGPQAGLARSLLESE